MANGVYDAGLEGLLDGSIDWLTDDIKVVLVDVDDYTVDFASDTVLDDIPSGALVDTSGNLTGKTVTLGALSADDVTVSGVSGDQFEAIVVYYDSGSDATSTLLAYLDTGVGFPLTPNGDDVLVSWDDGVVIEIGGTQRAILAFDDEAARLAATPQDGTLGWQTDTGTLYVYVEAATPGWELVITGAVPKSTVTTAGDLIYGTAADTVARLPLGTAAQVLRVDAGATAPEWATVSSGDPTPRRVVLPSSSYYCVPTTISDIDGAFQTSSLAQQAMWWPCYTHRAVTVAALATYCGTLEAGSTMRFGIYANTGSDLAVGSLLADFGTVSGASTGAKEVSGSQAVSAGYFWVCNWQSNHSTVRWLRRSFGAGLPPSFAGVQNAYGRHFMGYKVTAVDYSAGLPASPPSLTLMDHVSDTQAAFPYWRFT